MQGVCSYGKRYWQNYMSVGKFGLDKSEHTILIGKFLAGGGGGVEVGYPVSGIK